MSWAGSPMTLSILIPTTGRRAELLAQVTAEFQRLDPGCFVVSHEGSSWGEGLNKMMQYQASDYILCACDDTLPHEGWFDAARAMLDSGRMPASRYFTRDGAPLHDRDAAAHGEDVGWCRSFLLTPALYETVGPFLDTTWWADINYSERLAAAGYPITACDGFCFTHLHGERDWLTDDEEQRQRRVYEEAAR